eukprot:16402695-Heterocapsa_arctica.AAC.1
MELELATLRKQQAEMDKICQEMYADYIQIEPDLEASLTGVRRVLGILREYYGGAALLQGDGSLGAQIRQLA